ncbi:mechanosensitive ion channel [Neolewinella lacunae]|uniref:Mechanosensitive ion channel n=1 Tax=Neolewinella lacunae TaxID=1517758 RepID=A0A923PSP5_9BACT|nr:mechanosensitive ion channel domain-containing protein [Neolewinella lacunae]MBC6996082.1 mechanosensitive ion channel [Neolewinella lacunae]MDN3633935.1 mechanosensitive ion channel [Neolewinella lacunae]
MDLNFITDEHWALVTAYAVKAAGALLVLFIGFWIANALTKVVGRQMSRSDVDQTIINFIRSLVSTGLKILVIIAAAGMVGVETASFIAVFGALAFAVGLALQGTLGHFASGIMLLFFRPYKVGDLVTIGGGQTGTVKELQIFNTVLATLDNKRVIVPNGTVTSNIITNISGQGIIGVELKYGIGYGDSIDKARAVILAVGKECPWILENPAQGVVVAEHGDSSINLATRPFCNSEHYWDTFFYMQENVKKAFDREGISIPFPQRDVHLIQPK